MKQPGHSKSLQPQPHDQLTCNDPIYKTWLGQWKKKRTEVRAYLDSIPHTNKNPWAFTDQRSHFCTKIYHIITLTSMAIPCPNCPISAARIKFVQSNKIWKIFNLTTPKILTSKGITHCTELPMKFRKMIHFKNNLPYTWFN